MYQKIIQKLIDECSDGGVVTIKKGNWYNKGPLHLKSNITLFLEKGATVYFSDDPSDYLPVVFTRWEGVECFNYSPLIYGKNLENITIKGQGKLIGNGKSWWNWKELQQKAANELVYSQSNGIPVEKRIYGTKKAALRPSFIQLINCKNVIFQDFTIEDGPQWTIHPVYCENVFIKNLKVITKGPNTDGLNPDSCKNVVIEKCLFSTGDDCIAINSGMNEDGIRVGIPCENIVIRDCKMIKGHGAIVVGSGMSGGVRNVRIANCSISKTMQGLRIKSMRGRGGYVKDIHFENIKIENVSESAIEVTMFYPYSTVEPKNDFVPIFEDITFKNISGNSLKSIYNIRGLQDSFIKGLLLESIDIKGKEDGIIDKAEILA